VGEVVEREVDGIPYREAGIGESPGDTVLLVHGFPETSMMWAELMESLAGAGYRALAPDLIGFGRNDSDSDSTWEANVELLERFVEVLDLGPVVLITHDWGALIGLRWACDNPGAASRMVISSSGFFSDGRWHGMAKMLRGPEGESIVAGMAGDGFEQMMRSVSPALTGEQIADYARAFTERDGKPALDLYRSGDFDKLAPYEGRLEALAAPTLLLWGENDQFAPIGGGYRFAKRLPDARLVVIEGGDHFVWSDEPERCAAEVLGFLSGT
jgi:haloalkane dehalogenase